VAETVGERVNTLEAWTSGHEKLCDQRQAAMGREIKELRGSVDGLTKGAWAIVLALLAFAATQLWQDLKDDQRPVPAIVQHR
jgi:hypothetical protein